MRNDRYPGSMKLFARWPAVLLSPVLSLCLLTGCGSSGEQTATSTTPPPAKLSVVVTNSVLAEFVRVLGGGQVNVRALVPQNGDVRNYVLTPDDVTDVANADLILSNGLGLEPWFDTFIKTADHRGVVASVTEGVDTRVDAVTKTTDPYAWVSPSNARVMIANIRNSLTQVSPNSASTFTASERAYDAQIDSVISYAQSATAPVRAKKLVYAGEPLGYFCQQFQMNCTGVAITGTPASVASSVQAANPVAVVFGPRLPSSVVDAVKVAVPNAKITSAEDVIDVTSVGKQSKRHPDYLALQRDIADLLSAQLR